MQAAMGMMRMPMMRMMTAVECMSSECGFLYFFALAEREYR